MLELVYTVDDFRTNEAGEFVRTGSAYTLRFDAVVSEKPNFAATLTEHAVEGGTSVSDHKIPQLRTLSLACVVTDSPLGDPPPSGSRTRRVTGRVTKVDLGGGISAEALAYSESVTRVADVLAELDDLVGRPVSITVRTDLRTYDGMQLVAVSAPRTPKDGSSIEFGLDFQELRTVRIEATTAPRPRMPRNRRRVDRGAQAAQEPTPTAETAAVNRRSALSFLTGGSS